MENERQGMTREKFLEQYPQMTEPLIEWEKNVGEFDMAGSIPLSSGRFVLIIRFEREWWVCFHNPANKPPHDSLECFLSHEAMSALVGLHSLLHKESDWSTVVDHIKQGEREDQSKGDL